MNMVVLTVHCKTSAKITLAPLLSFMNKNLYIFIVQTESYWICQSSLFVFKLEYFMMQYCGSLKCKTWHRFVIMKCLNHFWNFKPINFHPTDQKHIFKHFLLRIPWFNKKKIRQGSHDPEDPDHNWGTRSNYGTYRSTALTNASYFIVFLSALSLSDFINKNHDRSPSWSDFHWSSSFF